MKRNIWSKGTLIISILTLPALLLIGQKNVIDEVVWIVGDEAILKSEVEQQKIRYQYENIKLEGDPYCIIPEQMAIQKLFLHQAELDSIIVSDAQVVQQVDQQINSLIAQIGSKEKMEEYFKKNSNMLREDLREMYKEQMTVRQMQNKLVGDLKITPAEVRRFYSQLPYDSIPTVPTQVEVQIITIEPPIPQAEIDEVKERLRGFSERVNEGSSEFSTLAILYSEDTESAKRGGELGFMGKGQLVKEFADVAFNLSDPKRVSRIVQSEFGYHIIQLIEKRGDRINCRHILLKPKASIVHKEKALSRLDSLATDIRANKITFDQAATFVSADKNTRNNKGIMQNPTTGTAKFELAQLPQEIAKVVYPMKVNEISRPFTMIDQASGKEVCAIVLLKSRTSAHKANIADDYLAIKALVQEKKSQEVLADFIKRKQQETYIRINPNWINCEFQHPGWIK